MTITLELEPEIESRANREAESSGKTVEKFLVEIIEEKLLRKDDDLIFSKNASDDEWEAALDSIAVYSDELPISVDDSRESIYGDRENAQL